MTLFVLVRTYLARVRGMRRVVRAHVYLDRCRVFLCHMKIFAALVLLRVDCILLHRAIIMPNLVPPVSTVQLAKEYRERVMAAVSPPKSSAHTVIKYTPTTHTRTLACVYAWTDAGAGTHTGTRTHTRISIRIRTCTHTYALAHIHSLHRRTLSRSRRPSTYVRPFFPTQSLYLLSITILCICMYCTYL